MQTPTEQQIDEAANAYFDEYYPSSAPKEDPIEDFTAGASYMEQQLEPIITELEMENMRLKALLYRWNQLNDPQDFYVCSATLKKETTAILFETNNP